MPASFSAATGASAATVAMFPFWPLLLVRGLASFELERPSVNLKGNWASAGVLNAKANDGTNRALHVRKRRLRFMRHTYLAGVTRTAQSRLTAINNSSTATTGRSKKHQKMVSDLHRARPTLYRDCEVKPRFVRQQAIAIGVTY